MASVPSYVPPPRNDYPTASSKPMPETDWHRDLMFLLIDELRAFFTGQPRVYVSGNLLLFYQPGNRRQHVSPDVFVVRGVENYQRPNYLLWEEGQAPQIVIELTSRTTRRSDLGRKYTLYQDVLGVREYFLFDPHGDYLDPQLQGYRLHRGAYRPIRAVHGRLASQVLGLHLERDGNALRLWNPATQSWLPTPAERTEQAEQRAETAERARQEEAQCADALAAELERLRRQVQLPTEE